MDFLQRCYVSRWRLWRDDLSRTVRGRYYWAPEGAPVLPIPHWLGSRGHTVRNEQYQGLGEVRDVHQIATDGESGLDVEVPAIIVGAPPYEGMTGTTDAPAAAPTAAGIDVRCWLAVGQQPPEWSDPVQTAGFIPMFGVISQTLQNSPLEWDGSCVVSHACLTATEYVDAPQLRQGGVSLDTLYVGGVYVTNAINDALAGYLTADDADALYLTHDQADAYYDPLGAAGSAVATHEAAADPHPEYVTEAEADARYDPWGAASGYMAAHEAAADPHPVYLTTSEGDARYATAGSGGTTILSGTTPPGSATGAVGDYYLDTSTGILWGPKKDVATIPEESLSITGGGPNGSNVNTNGGVRFQANVPITIVRVKYNRRADSADTLNVSLWNDDAGGANIFTVYDTRPGQSGWFEVAIPGAVSVPAGGIRTISLGSGGNIPWNSNPQTISGAPNVLSMGAYHTGGTSPTRPVTGAGQTYYVSPIWQAAEIWRVAVWQVPVTDSGTVDLTASSAGLTAATRQQMSVTSDSAGLKLSGDVASPGNSKRYGTSGSGSRGWLDARVLLGTNYVATSQGTTSTTPVALATADSVTVSVPDGGPVVVIYSACVSNTAGGGIDDSVWIDGVQDTGFAPLLDTPNAGSTYADSWSYVSASLTAGTHTIEVKHDARGGGTSNWSRRRLTVLRA